MRGALRTLRGVLIMGGIIVLAIGPAGTSWIGVAVIIVALILLNRGSSPASGLATAIRAAAAAQQAQVTTAAAATGAPADPYDQLARLGKLHQQGVLTDTEFEQAKAKLLATAGAGSPPAPPA